MDHRSELINLEQDHHSLNKLFRRQIALPQDHGSWIFLFSPLAIGIFAGGSISIATLYLVIASVAVFLVRQPLTILTKIYSGRRAARDKTAAWFWTIIYSLTAALGVAGLVVLGFNYLLILAIPGFPVFAWHLWLVSRREERRQIGVEIVASGVLSLTAPAGYWVGIGTPDSIGWLLFLLSWLQSAASIVYAYLRLEQRQLESQPEMPVRLRMGRRALLYTSFNLIFVITLAVIDIVPRLIPLPYLATIGF